MLQLSLQEAERSILSSEQRLKFSKTCTTRQLEPRAELPVLRQKVLNSALQPTSLFSVYFCPRVQRRTLSHPQKGCHLQLFSHLLCAWLELVTVLTPERYWATLLRHASQKWRRCLRAIRSTCQGGEECELASIRLPQQSHWSSRLPNPQWCAEES